MVVCHIMASFPSSSRKRDFAGLRKASVPELAVEDLAVALESAGLQDCDESAELSHRMEQPAPRSHRYRICSGSSDVHLDKGLVFIHLWSEPSFMWTLDEHLMAATEHLDLLSHSSFVVSIRKLRREWQTVKVSMPFERSPSGYGEVTFKMLTILVVKCSAGVLQAASFRNMEFYLRDLFGVCQACFVCQNPRALGSLRRPYVFFKLLLLKELQLVRAPRRGAGEGGR